MCRTHLHSSKHTGILTYVHTNVFSSSYPFRRRGIYEGEYQSILPLVWRVYEMFSLFPSWFPLKSHCLRKVFISSVARIRIWVFLIIKNKWKGKNFKRKKRTWKVAFVLARFSLVIKTLCTHTYIHIIYKYIY